ncbi:MAG: V4R domain-containing protein [Candidatus Jordarchaeum sp.]|uniref:V4R domain-containing protein n=1 Tax=Candidatus Jordarchaeum sp. TaxID=2823881 RepID=UPI00404B6A68
MELETRVPVIDFSLGKLLGGQVLLFTADSSTLNDAMLLSMLVTFNLIDQGLSCVAIQTDEPYFLASKKFKHSFLPEKFPLLVKAMDEGRFTFLDLVSNKFSEDITGVILVRNDVERILYEVTQVIDRMKINFPDSKVIVLYHNISSTIVDFDSKIVLNMLRKMIAKIKQEGNIFVGVVNRDIHVPEITNILKHLSSYTMELGLDSGDSPHPYLQVTKTPLVGFVKRILHKKLAYHISGNKFETFSPISFYLDELEDGQVFYQKGEVSILGIKHLVLPILFVINILKAFEKSLDYELYRKIVLEVGVDFGARNVKNVESEFHLKGDNLLLSTLKYVGARGYGKLLSTEGSLGSGSLKIRVHSSLAEVWGKSDKPVDVLIEGGLLGVVQEITGKEWNIKETMCMAMGDEYCLFELTQV